MQRRAAALLALVLTAAVPAGRIGVEMPSAGDDGARGLAATAAIRLALGDDRIAARGAAHGTFLNPHQDEGSDNDTDVRLAPSIAAAFAADSSVVAAIGGLRRNVGDADAAAADARGLPMVVLARWSRAARPPNAYCMCVSPPRLVAFARGAARARFGGARMQLALVGAAVPLAALWRGRFGDATISRVDDSPASLPAARRRALDVDAVLVIADERPPALWRASAFRRAFDGEYVRDLAHRDFSLVPAGTNRGDVLEVRQVLAAASRRSFVQRFRTSAGFAPSDEAARAYAAAEVLRDAGTTRTEVRAALAQRRFDTAAGPVTFDRDGYWGDAVLTIAP